jgi:hypothetical protein
MRRDDGAGKPALIDMSCFPRRQDRPERQVLLNQAIVAPPGRLEWSSKFAPDAEADIGSEVRRRRDWQGYG